MIKLLHVLAIAGLIGSAVYAYGIKYETIYQAEELARLRAQVQRERDTIAVLRAEWAHLNRPDRVQAIADRHLPDLVPLGVQQLARFSDLPVRAPKTDEIGRKLELLGLSAPTATPSSPGSGDARTPSTRTPAR